jgi:hypothetical protein
MRREATRREAWMAALMLISLCVVVREWNRDPVVAMFAALVAVLFGVWAALFLKMRYDFSAMLPDLHQSRRQYGDTRGHGFEVTRSTDGSSSNFRIELYR